MLFKSKLLISLLSGAAGTVILLAGISLAILALVTDSGHYAWFESFAYSGVGAGILLTCYFYLREYSLARGLLCLYYLAAIGVIATQIVKLDNSLSSVSFQFILLVFAILLCVYVLYVLYRTDSQSNQ